MNLDNMSDPECMVVTLYSIVYECMCKPTFTAIALSVTNRILHDITAHGAWRLLVGGTERV